MFICKFLLIKKLCCCGGGLMLLVMAQRHRLVDWSDFIFYKIDRIFAGPKCLF